MRFPIVTKMFADGAELDSIIDLLSDARISGFTTNPSLMRKAGLTDYESFAKTLLEKVTSHPVSLEVCSDEPKEIIRQAEIISSWAPNVYVKIPVTTTSGEPLAELAGSLSRSGIKVNVTAVFTIPQVLQVGDCLLDGAPSYISVFAGRIADAGVDPVPIVSESVRIANERKASEIIWASPREVFNLVQADSIGCHIITMTPDLLKKVDQLGKDLKKFSLETVSMFYLDAMEAGLRV